METIGKHTLWSLSSSGRVVERSCFSVRKSEAYQVKNYVELATKIAALQFKNPDYVLLFRGQTRVHIRTNKNGVAYTSLAPKLFRGNDGGNPSSHELERRFDQLRNFELQLVARYSNEGYAETKRLKRQQILRWTILQHYEVCPTPLLDVTNSLRIAASFASHDAEDEAYVFALGVPNLSGAITASAEAGLQIVRLSSVCPPEALRPHLQEGYLLGEYPEMREYDQKQHYSHVEVDFGRRLVAKFRFDPRTFWEKSSRFPQVTKAALYPRNDPLDTLAQSIKHI